MAWEDEIEWEDNILISNELLTVFTKLSGPAIKVYGRLLSCYKAGVALGVNKYLKRLIAKELGITEGTVSNTLVELCTWRLVYKYPSAKGTYFINPRYAYKGSSEEMKIAIKEIIELGCTDC